jgi:hypothetical protein
MAETLLSTTFDGRDPVIHAAFKVNDRMNHLNDSLDDLGLSWGTIPLAQGDAAEYVRSGQISEEALLAKLARHGALNSFLAGKIHIDAYTLGVCQFYVRFGGDLADLIDCVQVQIFFRAHVGCSRIKDREDALYNWMCKNDVATILALTPSTVQSDRRFDILLVRRALAFSFYKGPTLT